MASVEVTTLPAVPITASAPFGGGISAKLVRYAPVKVADAGPGVLKDAPATAFTIEFTNDSLRSISLASVQVGVEYGRDLAASPVNQNRGDASGELRPGGSKRARYSFAIPLAELGNIRVAVWIGPARPTVVFSGSAR